MSANSLGEWPIVMFLALTAVLVGFCALVTLALCRGAAAGRVLPDTPLGLPDTPLGRFKSDPV